MGTRPTASDLSVLNAWDHSAMVRALEILADHEIGGWTKS
jgi:hypothetical protein